MKTDLLRELVYPACTTVSADQEEAILGAEFALYDAEFIAHKTYTEGIFPGEVTWGHFSHSRWAFDHLSFTARRAVLMAFTKGELAKYV